MNRDIQWKAVQKPEDLDEMERYSANRPVILFKHSTRCGLSHEVKDKLEEEWSATNHSALFYYLDILEYRALSDEVEHRWRIAHQSPQLIILSDQEVLFHGSHRSITAKRIEKVLADN